MRKKSSRSILIMKPFLAILALGFIIASCSDQSTSTIESETMNILAENAEFSQLDINEVYTFDGPVFDIAALPNGNILVADFAVVKEISKRGVKEVTTLPLVEGPGAGGTVKKCDVNTDSCEIIEGGDGTLFLPGAITFDKWDNLWLLDNVFAPTVRQISWN